MTNPSENDLNFRSGYAAIVGRPNVGKSTLLNRLLGQKISITSPKPQTTRHRILGIHTKEHYQINFVDTPGLHQHNKNALNRYMNRVAVGSLDGVDVVVWVVEGLTWESEDELLLQRLETITVPVILVVNKIDEIADKQRLLPHIQSLAMRRNFTHILPLSAHTGEGTDLLEAMVAELLPQSAAHYPEDQVTDRSERFLTAEVIREKLMRHLDQELPYAITVEIEQFRVEGNLTRINALIWVEKASQKAIVIGKQGSMLKNIGREARLELEKILQTKVFLELWVKVKEHWADNERFLQGLGYSDE